MEICPVCQQSIPLDGLETHINQCLDHPPSAPTAVEDPVVEGGLTLEEIMLIKKLENSDTAWREQKMREEAENERLFLEFLAQEKAEEDRREREKQAAMNDLLHCVLCNNKHPIEQVFFTLETCAHFACKDCMSTFVLGRIESAKCSEVVCPTSGCGKSIAPADLKQLLSAEDVERFHEASIKEMVNSNPNAFVECPKCRLVIERLANSQIDINEQVLGPDGKPLSAEALAHRGNNRFRCRECQTEFCGGCRVEPYHLGFTCEQFTQYQKARHCRFCTTQLKSDNTAPSLGWASALQDCCTSEECQKKRSHACPIKHPCGHNCLGIKGDAKRDRHMPCLHDDCVKTSSSSQKGDDYCNICWVESLEASPCIQLDCGHVFHYDCISKKISNKWAGAMITFGFLDCPLCKKQISHPSLKEELKGALSLYEDVKTKATARLKFMNMQDAKELKDKSSPYYEDPEKYSLARFCFYPCFKCHKPYFGGLKECNAEQRVADFDPKELICGSCSSAGSEGGNCPKHGADYIEYKCRFCCNVACWFCWGTTHFCEECHKKAGEMAKKSKNQLPPCTCSIKHPPNGDEFCLGCSVCRFDVL